MSKSCSRWGDDGGLEALAGLRSHDMASDSTRRLAHGMRLTFDAAHDRARNRSIAALSRSFRTVIEPAFLATVSASYLVWAVRAVLLLWARE